MPSIVILGLPKSGTSALYAAIKQQGDFLAIFEPGNERQISYVHRHPKSDRLVKILYPKLWDFQADLSFFEKKILIVRDPRDMVVSWLLYRPLLHKNYERREFIGDLLDLLRQKEADPHSVSIQRLHSVFDRHGVAYTRFRDYRAHFEMREQLQEQYPDLHLFKYEDFVDGDVAELSRYLDVPLSNTAALGEHVSYNERSKSYGNWRHWFTSDDVDAYRPIFKDEIAVHGYDESWDLAERPAIEPAISSEYLERSVARVRRFSPNFGSLKSPDYYVPEYLTILRTAIDDGAEGAMIELALAHKHGYGVEQNLQQTIALLNEAEARGNPLAIVHLGLAHEYGVGVKMDQNLARERYKTLQEIRGNNRAKEMIGRHRAEWNHQ